MAEKRWIIIWGLDLTVLNNRLKINTDVYWKDTDPMLVTTSIASSTGVILISRIWERSVRKELASMLSELLWEKAEDRLNWSFSLNGGTSETDVS